MQPTYSPSKLKRKRTHGWFARKGSLVVWRRRRKGRKNLTA